MDARTFGQFIGFPIVQLQGTDVQKVNISTFYTFAKWMYDLRKLSAGDSLSDQETLRIVLAAKIGILLFFQPSTDAIGFPHTRGAVQRLWDFLDKNTDPKNTTDTLNPEGILDERFIDAINSYVDSFETMFHQEGATTNVFAVTKKGIFELDSLIASAVESLPPVIVSRLSADAVHNINAAGRCLALDSPTACGFHILRAVESLMRDYHFKLTGAALAVKSRNWGAFIKELN